LPPHRHLLSDQLNSKNQLINDFGIFDGLIPVRTSMSKPVKFADKSLTDRAVVAALPPGRVRRPQRIFIPLAATMRQIAARALMAALLFACILAATISFAPFAAAKGQEGGVVCTGTEMAAGTCRANALQATPIGSVPLGCQPSSHDTVACGRLGYHEFAGAPAPSAGSASNGPTQATATPPGMHSGVTAGAQPQASRHASR
jgi:hypothetical protein